jgi:hypothetical protein
VRYSTDLFRALSGLCGANFELVKSFDTSNHFLTLGFLTGCTFLGFFGCRGYAVLQIVPVQEHLHILDGFSCGLGDLVAFSCDFLAESWVGGSVFYSFFLPLPS